jgi:hemolysin activation/secretion protein
MTRAFRASLLGTLLLLSTSLLQSTIAMAEDAGGLVPNPTIGLKAMHVRGSTIAPDLTAALHPLIGRPASESTLRQAAAALNRAYGASDIAIYTITLDRLADDGVLEVGVVEGHVEGFQFEGKARAGAERRVRRIAEKLRGEGPLHKGQLQRALRLIGDISGAKVEADMIAGRQPGGLILRFRIDSAPPRLSLSFDNNGNGTLGRAQATASASMGSLLTGGDRVDILYTRSISGRGEAWGATYAMPIGFDGLQAGLSAVRGSSVEPIFGLRGRSLNFSASLSYPLHIGPDTLLSATAAFDAQQSDIYYGDLRLITERSRVARATVNWTRSDPRSRAAAALSVARTLDLPGAQATILLTDKNFTKLRFSAAYHRLLTQNLVLRLGMTAQYSADALPSVESLALGGTEYGRGFEPAVLTADKGIAGSAELAWSPTVGKAGRQVELYTYVDGARATYNERLISYATSFSLASSGGGVRVKDGPMNVDLSANRVVHDPYAGFGDRWRLTIGVTLNWP